MITQPTAGPDTSPAPKGPASYFPSIERNHGRPIEHWIGLVREQHAAGTVRHGELVAWQEVGITYPFENLAGARPKEPSPGESPLCRPRCVIAARKRQQHLTRIRHGEDVTRW